MKKIFLFLLLYCFILNGCATKRISEAQHQGDYQAAKAAFMRGDYAESIRLLRPLADQGDPEAQQLIGGFYENGKWVPQDFAEAAKWYHKAAEQGSVQGQANLGFMYAMGRGVSKNNVLAYMWLELAVAKGNADAMWNRRNVAAQMTPDEIKQAQRIAKEWKPNR
jgi:TPR repeat protein